MYCDVKFALLVLLISCSDMSISSYLPWRTENNNYKTWSFT